MLNFRLKFFLFSAFVIAAVSAAFPRVTFAAYDVQCVADGVNSYFNEVMDNAGSYTHLRFLTPAFNFTEPQFEELAQAFYDGTDFGSRNDVLIAGNAYNIEGQSVNQWIDRVRASALGGRPLILTETGWFPHDTANGYTDERAAALRQALADAAREQNMRGGLIFNGFHTNDGRELPGGGRAFEGQGMTDDQFRQVCNGGCGYVGVNSASGLFGPELNARAQSLGMGWTLGIIHNNPEGEAIGANYAIDRGLKPVLRIGVGTDSTGFSNPADLVSFMNAIDPLLHGEAYIIIGPNEPDIEGWADLGGAGSCERTAEDGAASGKVTVRGMLKAIRGQKTLPNGQTATATNIGVENATVVVYQGTEDSKTNKVNGRLVNPPTVLTSGLKYSTRTEKDGYFEVELERGSGRGNINYIVVSCQNTGNPTSDITTIYAVDSTKSVDGLMIYEDCPELATTPDPPSVLEYFTQADFLSCRIPDKDDLIYKLYEGYNNVAKGVQTFIDLENVSDTWWNGQNADLVPNPHNEREEEEQTHAEIYGRFGTSLFAGNFTSIFGGLTCLANGCADGNTLVGYNEDLELPSCSIYKESNEPLNARNNYGFKQNLADPSYNIESDDVRRYISYRLDPILDDKDVCNLEGHNYKLSEFQLPTQWAQDDIYAQLGGKTLCEVGSGFCLPEEYFPWNILTNFENRAKAARTNTGSNNDSYNSPTGRDDPFVQPNKLAALSCGTGATPNSTLFVAKGSTDVNAECPTSPEAFNEDDAVVFAEGNLTSPIAAANAVTRGAKNPGLAAPTEYVADPKTKEEELELAEGKIRRKFTTVSTGGAGITRIGKPQSLCICPWVMRLLGLCGANEDTLNAILGAEAPDTDFNGQEYLMNYFDAGYAGLIGSGLHDYSFASGYSYVTAKNQRQIVAGAGTVTKGVFYNWPVDWLTAAIQGIYNNFIAPWWDTGTKQKITRDMECAGAWVGATPAQAAVCDAGFLNDPAQCLSREGCGDCRCEEDNDSTCGNWSYYTDRYTCTPTAEVPPVDPSIGTSLPTRNLAIAAGNFMGAFRGPFDPNPRIKDGGAVSTEATGVKSYGQARGTDFSFGESMVDYWDQLSQSVADPNTANRVFGLTRVMKKPTKVVLPEAEDQYCRFGTTEGLGVIPELPDALVEVLEAAGDEFHVPAPLLLSFMYSEGAFNQTASNPLNGNWTEDEVRRWIDEDMETVGGASYCDPAVGGTNPYRMELGNWEAIDGSTGKPYGNSVLRDFPNRTPNICNFLDVSYAMAALIKDYTYVTPTPDNYCFGVEVSTPVSRNPASCSDWDKKRAVFAAKDYVKDGFCHDNENSGLVGSGLRTGNRQNWSTCLPSAQSCMDKPSYIFNVLYRLWFYTVPELRSKLDGAPSGSYESAPYPEP